MNKFKFLLPVLIGLVLGVGAAYGDTLYNNRQFDLILILTNYLNTGSVWTLTAFFVGSQYKSWKFASLAAVSTLLVAVGSYYIYGVNWGNRSLILPSVIMREVATWGILALVVGSVYGAAGSIAKFSENTRLKILSVSLVSLVLFAENGFFFLQSYQYANVDAFMVVSVLAGVILPFVLLKNFKHGLIALGIALLLCVGGIFLLQNIFWLLRRK